MPDARDVGLYVAFHLAMLVGHPHGDDLVLAILPGPDLTLLVLVQDLDPLDGEVRPGLRVEVGRVGLGVDHPDEERHDAEADTDDSELVA